jgi:CBS domain containing-hemolysin-like protein
MTQPSSAETGTVLAPPKTAEAEEPPSWRGLVGWVRHFLSARNDANGLRDAVEALIADGSAEQDVPAAERLLLANILHLQECSAADCMLPRAAIVAVEVSTPLADLVTIMAETQHSRIPVYRETLDDILGMVHMKDVLSCLARGSDCAIKDLLRQVLFIPPSTPALRLLQQMRGTRHYMALVVDEFGGIDGIVTIEDVLEEIVGEIDDEHDEIDTPQIITRPDGSLLLEARLPIEAFEERVGSILTEDERAEIDTVGGLVFLLAGRMPRVGESFTHPTSGMLCDVLEVDHSRILRLRLRNLPLPATTPAPVADGKQKTG